MLAARPEEPGWWDRVRVAVPSVLGALSHRRVGLSRVCAEGINDGVTGRKLSALEVAWHVAVAHKQFTASNRLSPAGSCGVCSGINLPVNLYVLIYAESKPRANFWRV